MPEYVDREKVIKEIDNGDLLVGNNAEWAKEIVYRTPTEDAVLVVRCKDCKHCKPIRTDVFSCKHWNTHRVYENDYCSYGERKDNNE